MEAVEVVDELIENVEEVLQDMPGYREEGKAQQTISPYRALKEKLQSPKWANPIASSREKTILTDFVLQKIKPMQRKSLCK